MKRLTNLNMALALSVFLVVTSTAKAVPNPAAWYCVQLGYEYQVRTSQGGGQYGVCIFPDGSECDGWDYFRKCYYGESSASCIWPCQELACRQGGEKVYLSECCEGLDEIYPAHVFDANCNETEMLGWLPICSDCGNGICEGWESKCNCPEDCRQPRIIYVDADATGVNDGSSWADAYNYLQDALADANSAEKPVEIRVAQGIYKPDQGAGVTPGDRAATFQLINGVSLKGGYAGFGEPEPNGRDIEVYESILSGDLAGNDVDVNDPCDLVAEPTRSENSYDVVTGSGTDATAVLDGVSITAGNDERSGLIRPDPQHLGCGGGICNDSGSPALVSCTFRANAAYGDGGGLYNTNGSKPTLANCTFSRNYAYSGAAMYNGEDSSSELTDCDFTGNCAAGSGGGLANRWSSPKLTDCRFKNNSASRGGGLSNYKSSPTLTNCMFSGNCARRWKFAEGGGMSNEHGSNPTLIGCTFWDNSAIEQYSKGGGMRNYNHSSPTLTDCVFADNLSKIGGGMYNEYYSSPLLYNCAFQANSAEDNGGGMYNRGLSSPSLTKCVVVGNSAINWGGGLFNVYNSNPTLANCTVSNNLAQRGGGLFNFSAGSILVNCIMWRDTAAEGREVYLGVELHAGGPCTITILYSDIEGGKTGVRFYDSRELNWGYGNIDADPCFAHPGYWDANGTPEEPNDDFWVDGDYHLKSQAGRWDGNDGGWTKDEVTSPCIDAGDPARPVGNEPFPNGGIINMGAYGGTAEASKSYFGEPVCETVVAGDINGDCKVNFKDFALMSFHWLEDNNR